MRLTEAQARFHGNLLKERLGPEIWELKVWENFGWHYNLRAGGISISADHSSGGIKYGALIGDRGSGYGEWHVQDGWRNADPIEAMRVSLQKAREVTDQRLSVVEASEEAFAATMAYQERPAPALRDMSFMQH